jgi:hypothetical protein
LAEFRTVSWIKPALEHKPTLAKLGVRRCDIVRRKSQLSIVLAILLTQNEPAARNDSESAPRAIHNFEHRMDEFESMRIPIGSNTA